MTRQKTFKRLVRARMDKTGESYTAARAMLLAAADAPGTEQPWLATSDEAIRERTGRGWEAWFDLLDTWGAAEQPHRQISRRLANELGIDPLAWAAQAITLTYERARGLRAVGQRADGFAITASKTIAVPVAVLREAFVDERRRRRWLPDGDLRQRAAGTSTSLRFDWGDGTTRVNVTFAAKGEAKGTVAVEHGRLPDASAAEETKAFWRDRLGALKAQLERGELDS